VPAEVTEGEPGWLRRVLLALVLLGIVGLVIELILLEHYDSAWQWTPIVLLGVMLPVTILVWLRPGRAILRVFQGGMTLFVVTGLLGLWLHYRGNVEFELERDAALSGWALFWEAMRGATPALAPAALTQLGVLGLAFAHRHPAIHPPVVRTRAADHARETS
jgi:hypothetical protein